VGVSLCCAALISQTSGSSKKMKMKLSFFFNSVVSNSEKKILIKVRVREKILIPNIEQEPFGQLVLF